MPTPTLRVSEPRELLALVPHQLGFHPRESVVLVSLRPPRGRVGLAVRVDLRDLADAAHGPRLARTLVAHLRRDRAVRALLVVYTEDDPRGGPSAVATAVAQVRDTAAGRYGDVPVWVVTSTGYLSFECDDDACCPPGGRPLSDLAATRVGAQMVLAGSAVADRREDVARIAPADAERRRSVARVRRRWLARRDAQTAAPGAPERWRADAVAAWRRAVDEQLERVGGPTAAALGRLEAGLTDVRVRDAVLVALVPGTGDLPERSVRGERPSREADDGFARALALVVDPLVGVPAPPAATRVHQAVLEAVVAHGERGRQAPALTLLGLLAWWRGDGARAQLLLERAAGDDPGYRLARLLDDAVGRGLPPGWVGADR